MYTIVCTCTGPPTPVGIITTSSRCVNIVTTWSSVVGHPLCGDVSYDVMLSLPDGTLIMNTTIEDNFYIFTGLTPDNTYTVTVAGRNNAGVGVSSTFVTRTKGKDYWV